MCDTLVSLTADGVLLAKNSDRDTNEAQVLRWYAAAEHPLGSGLTTTWSTIPQVSHTNAVLLSQPWWMWGAEIGANEHGVSIGNEAVFTRRTGRKDEGALLGMDLLRLGLERAATAEAAVEVIVSLLEEHGQGGACSYEDPKFRYDNSFLIADREGAIVLETAGRRWATEQVKGRGRSISNGLTIAGFAEKYADPIRGRFAACSARRARTEAAAGAATGPAELFAALRDHGQTGSPVWSRVNGSLSAPCVHGGGRFGSQTTASWVADLRTDLHWVTGTSAPCMSLFKPVRVTEPAAIDPEEMPSNRFDADYRWWRHEQIHRIGLRNPALATYVIGPDRDARETRWLADPPDTATAFSQADILSRRWLDNLKDFPLPELRPGWLQRQWQSFDNAARIRSLR